MLIDLDITIAYKCSSCGTFDFHRVSIFNLVVHKNNMLFCKCGKAHLSFVKSDKNGYCIMVPCIGCGAEHQYTMTREALIGKNIIINSCPVTGIKNCFIGKDYFVRKFIDKLEKELDGIIDGYGYESYFENTRVMLDTLNRIHDIAEMKHLRCECGNTDITVAMFRKGIGLKCNNCYREKFIPASTNNDLKIFLQKDSIVLYNKKSKVKIKEI